MKLLIESIQILGRFATEIGNRANLIVDFGFPKKGFNNLKAKELTLLNALFYMSVIDTYSYLSEYEQVFGVKTESNFKERVLDVKSINKLFITKIKEWRDLGNLRNQLLAHNLRQGKNGQFIFGIDNLDYNAPRTINDLFLLSNLIQFATETIHLEFSYELKINNVITTKMIKPQNNSLTKEEVSSITLELVESAKEEIKRLNKYYRYSSRKPISIPWDKI